MRVLDELADAIHVACGWSLPRSVQSSVELTAQFGYRITPVRWAVVQRCLGCPLPSLTFDQGHWWLPLEFTTVWDLAAQVARCRPEWEPPAATTPAAWREAQVFAGVRHVLIEAGNLNREAVVRKARLMADLKLE
jgi:hypothetical protein